MNNIGDSEAMRNAIWATLFHCASTDISPQHEKCPDHAESWCLRAGVCLTRQLLRGSCHLHTQTISRRH